MSTELLKTLCYLLTGGFLVFLAVTITRDNFSNRLNRVTGGMLFFAGLGPIMLALGAIAVQSADGEFRGSTLYNLRHLWELFFPCLLMFSWMFPEDRLSRSRHARWRYLVLVPQIMHVVIILFAAQLLRAVDVLTVDPSSEGLSTIVLKPLSVIFSWIGLAIGALRTYETNVFGMINLVYVFAAIYFLESGARRATNPRILTQTRWVLWGTRIGLGLYVIAQLLELLVPGTLSGDSQSVMLIAALLIGAGLIIFATIRHQFLDVQMVFRQSFVNTVTSALLVGLYVVMVVQARNILAPLFGVRADMVSYGFIIIMLLFFQPISSWLDDLVRSMFIRTRTDHRNVLERFSRQVISEFQPVRLRQIIGDMLKTTLLVDRVYFCIFDDEVEEYSLLQSEDYPRRYVANREDLMLRGINLLRIPTFYRSLSDYRQDSDLAAVLEGRGVEMILPLKDADHMLGFLALTAKAAGYRYSSEDMNLLGVLSNQMVSALTNARLYGDSLERLRLQEEINMARQIQLDLLPSQPPQLSCAKISCTSTPSRTVGGDFYDFLDMPDKRLGIVIADASGKGMPAALMIAQTQAIIRNEVSNGNPISAMLKRTNQHISDATSAEKYVTLFYCELDLQLGMLRFANAGHNYPILARKNGDIEHLVTGGPIIGAFPFMEYESASVKLEPDDYLFLFTDGLSEAMDESDVEYGEKRLAEIIRDNRSLSPDELVKLVLEDVRSHDPAYPPQDDTTIVAIKMCNGVAIHEPST